MLKDEAFGLQANAACGYEMFSRPHNHQTVKALKKGKNMILSGKPYPAVIAMFNPLPEVFSNLYSTWNLAFCLHYANAPMFFAKLLNPMTAGTYHAMEGLYLYPRVLTLWMHIHYLMFRRVELQTATPEGLDWQSPKLQALWGLLNKEAGHQYRDQVDKAMRKAGFISRLIYFFRKRRFAGEWTLLKKTVDSTAAMRDVVHRMHGHGKSHHGHGEQGNDDAASVQVEILSSRKAK